MGLWGQTGLTGLDGLKVSSLIHSLRLYHLTLQSFLIELAYQIYRRISKDFCLGNRKNLWKKSLIHLFIVTPAFPLRSISGAGVLGVVEMPHGFQPESNNPACRSPTTPANACELNPPIHTQTFQQKHNNLSPVNRRPLKQYSRSTPQSFSRETWSYAFSRSTKHV